MNKLPQFVLRLPSRSIRKVWIGCYSSMNGTVIMMFSKKPRRDHGEYTVLDDNYIASFWIEEWEYWFGTVQPLVDAGLIEDREGMYVVTGDDLECHRVIRVEVEMAWDEDGMPIGLNLFADN